MCGKKYIPQTYYGSSGSKIKFLDGVKYMKQKKILILFCLCIFASCSLVGCKDKELQAREEEIRDFASENSADITENYIKAKYDIDAEMDSYDLESSDSLFYSYLTGTVYCIMEYENEAFLCIYNVDDTACISDNLQSAEIQNDIQQFLEETCNMPSAWFCDISYSEGDYCSGAYVEVRALNSYVYVENCIHEFYNGDLSDLFEKLDYLYVEVEFDSESSVKDFIFDEQLSKISSVSINLTNETDNMDYASSRCFNLKETLHIRKSSDGEITEEYLKVDIAEIAEGYRVAYNGVSDISASVTVTEIDDVMLEQLQEYIDLEEYEIVSPVFYGVGDVCVMGGIAAEIYIEDYDDNYLDYYMFKYKDNLTEGSISNCSEFVELYKESNIIILKKK